MSGNAAREISTMLEDSIRKVEETVNETKTKVESLIWSGKEKVESGTHIAQECGQVLEEITNNISLVTQMPQKSRSLVESSHKGFWRSPRP